MFCYSVKDLCQNVFFFNFLGIEYTFTGFLDIFEEHGMEHPSELYVSELPDSNSHESLSDADGLLVFFQNG